MLLWRVARTARLSNDGVESGQKLLWLASKIPRHLAVAHFQNGSLVGPLSLAKLMNMRGRIRALHAESDADTPVRTAPVADRSVRLTPHHRFASPSAPLDSVNDFCEVQQAAGLHSPEARRPKQPSTTAASTPSAPHVSQSPAGECA